MQGSPSESTLNLDPGRARRFQYNAFCSMKRGVVAAVVGAFLLAGAVFAWNAVRQEREFRRLIAAGDTAQRVDIDIAADSDLQANYQVAVSKQTSNRKAAEAWVKFVRSDDALQVFADYAFGTQ